MSLPDYDEDADLQFGFDSVTLDEPAAAALSPQPAAPTPTAAPAPAETTEPPPTQEDPFASYPQAVRDLLGQVPRLTSEIERLNRVAGMVPALQREVDRLKSGAAAPPPREATPAPAPRFEKVAKLRTEGLDDIADAIDEIAQALPPKTTAPAAPAAEAAPAASAPSVEPPDDPVLRALEGARPGWYETLRSSECQLWLTQQPGLRREIEATDDPKVILDGLRQFDRFKAATHQPPAPQRDTRQARMAAAVTPRGDGRSSRGAPDPVDDEEAAFRAGFAGR